MTSKKQLALLLPVLAFSAPALAGSSSDGIQAMGHFNSGTYLDVAIVSPTADKVYVRMGNGDGTFASASPSGGYVTGDAPESVAVADFDDASYDDMAVVNSGESSLSVFLNNGNSTFASKVDYTTRSAPIAVTAADVNLDGSQDLIVAYSSGDYVSVFINNDDGTFASKVDYTVGNGSTSGSISTGDFNNDSYPDIVVVNSDDATVSVLLNTGSTYGSFGSASNYTLGSDNWSTGGVTVGDVNDDGYADIAVVNSNESTVSVLMNEANGNGTFSGQAVYAVGDASSTGGIAMEDFNRDGHNDIVAVNPGYDNVSVLINNGDGTFATQETYATASAPRGVVSADFNNDTYPDLLVVSASGDITVLMGLGDGSFE